MGRNIGLENLMGRVVTWCVPDTGGVPLSAESLIFNLRSIEIQRVNRK